MKTNARLLFKFLLRQCNVDCIFDIGSCDGYESSQFRQLRPAATVVAFEANPFLYKRMVANPNLKNITILPLAVSDKNGTAKFFVSDIDYDHITSSDPAKNKSGTSSLILNENVKVREAVETPTRRIDDFLLAEYPQARNVALWIDVEGAEHQVLEGMAGIKDRVVCAHVETARVAMRPGQRTLADLETLMKSLGFVLVGDNMFGSADWGDAVFIRQTVLDHLGLRYHLCRLVGWLSFWCRVNLIGTILKNHCYPLYRVLSALYVKLFG